MYEIILKIKLFNAIDESSYILINIKDSEDLSNPNLSILECLAEAKKYGCQTYLIYLANGIQAENFLRLLDK